MAMSGTEKEMRMQSSLPYNHHLIRESSSETLDHGSPDPDRFATGATISPISVGSKLKTSAPPRYRECLKNHAANIGGNITDGCGEFMPSGDEGTLEALKCAACNCHRNFHRKETSATATDFSRALVQLPPPLPSPSMTQHHHRGSISLHNNHHHWASSINAPPVKMAFGGSGGGGSAATDSSSEELNFNAGAATAAAAAVPQYGMSKKRFRTKFTQDQKEKMLEFAEKVGWRIPREDDPEVQRFCAEVGVKRQVLKVWMHNNKGSSGKKQVQETNGD